MQSVLVMAALVLACAGDGGGNGVRTATSVRELIERLGSSRYAERESASSELERRGANVLDELRKAEHDHDPEIRSRAAALVRRIEGGALTKPTLLKLDFRDRPLPDVVAAIGRQSRFKIALVPEDYARLRSPGVTLAEDGPVPFWTAIDRLCETAGLQYSTGLASSGSRESVFTLSPAMTSAATPHHDHGPFRTNLLGLFYQKDVTYSVIAPARPQTSRQRPALHNDPRPVTNSRFSVLLAVSAEPRLTIVQSGPVKWLEAADNQGQSLIPDTGGSTMEAHYAGFMGFSASSTFQVQCNLHHPPAAGQTIKTLKGLVPLLVSARRPEPIVVQLDGTPAGKSFGPVDELTVHDIRTVAGGRQTMIEISIRPAEKLPEVVAVEAPAAFRPTSHRDLHRLQIEILDDRGEFMSWAQPGMNLENGRITITLFSPRGSHPKELRYYHLIQTVAAAPFEFHNIPLP